MKENQDGLQGKELREAVDKVEKLLKNLRRLS